MAPEYDTAPWLSGFAIPEAPTGAVLAMTFGQAGVWLGRVTGDKRIVASQSEMRIVPNVLDMRIADELAANGTVPEAQDPDVYDELTALAARARESIGDRDSALVMGTGALRIVSVTRADCVEATVPEVNRIHGMIVELAGDDPVDAILLGPGTDDWPGLWEALSERGFTVLMPGDDFPTTFGGDDDQPTSMLDRVEAAPASLAWGAASDDLGPVSFSASGIDPADYGLDEYGNVQFDGPGTDPGLVVDIDDEADRAADEKRAAENKRRRRITAAAAVVVLLGLGGVGTAVGMNIHEHNGPSMDELNAGSTGTPDTSDEESSDVERVPGSVDKKELAAARATMIRYTTPPPPPKETTPKDTGGRDRPTQRPERPGTGPAPRPTHRKRTIPNPIPGLPPIVVG